MLVWLSLVHAAPVGLSSPSGELVLAHTAVSAEVVADLAVVDVVQTFENPFEVPVDATYVFPLPADAAVRDMTVSCGERTIHSELLDREEARARFEEARDQGIRAALTEQQRSNVFTQEVAGLCPGEVVEVTLQYVAPLEVDAGVHGFVFPTTLGRRYEPGDLQEPPLVAASTMTRRVSLRLSVHAGMPLDSVWSDTHDIVVVGEDEEGAEIELLDEAVPDGDIHVAWTEGVDRTKAVVVAAEDDVGDRYVSLSLVPPAGVPDAEARHRELVFVLDSSCSMMGAPWEAATAVVSEALTQLRPEESFNLVRFSDDAEGLFERPMAATPEAVEEALGWLRRYQGGGTNMQVGMNAALRMDGDPEALRMVLMVTDGFIGSGFPMFQDMERHLATVEGRNDRVFALGIGASVNDELLDGLALHGRGASSVLRPGVPVAEEVERFYRRIDQPVLTDIEVDWGDLGALGDGVLRPADVFAGQPLHLVARLDGKPFGEVRVRGTQGGQPVELVVPVDVREVGEHEAVRTLWARRQIAAAEQDPWASPEERNGRVASLALEHRLVSRLTSLVAVDDRPGGCRAEGAVDVPQAVPMGTEPPSNGGPQVFGSLSKAGSAGVLGAMGSGVGGGGSAMGLGGLGTRGTGRAGYGSGGGNFGTAPTKGEMTEEATSWSSGVSEEAGRTMAAVLARHRNQLRYCYQRALAKQPGLGGRLRVRFTVGPDGEVDAAGVEENTVDAAVGDCVVGRVMRMTFPSRSDGMSVQGVWTLGFRGTD